MADGRGGIDSGRWDMDISRADGEDVCHGRRHCMLLLHGFRIYVDVELDDREASRQNFGSRRFSFFVYLCLWIQRFPYLRFGAKH
jgi:hypothetical protein